jgi:hypothetical protein
MTATIDKLKSEIAVRGGLARPNNFLVELPSIGEVSARDMNLLCTNAVLPSKDILNIERYIGMERQQVAYGYQVAPVVLSFILTNDYAARRYFDAWRSAIVNEDYHVAAYKQSYARKVAIHQLEHAIEQGSTEVNKVRSVYGIELKDAYPSFTGDISFNNLSDAYIEMTVQLTYTNWKVIPSGRVFNI